METSYLHAVSGNDVRQRLAEMPCSNGDAPCSFDDLIDVVNPLQHLPIIGTLYREASGDAISSGAQLAGGFLFGGPLGLITASINAGIEALTGDDVGGHLLAFLTGGDEHKYAAAAYQKASDLG